MADSRFAIHDSRPERVYGVLVRGGTVFLSAHDGRFGLPGGVFRPLAEDRKVELKGHLEEQLGIRATAVWAQGGFDYQHPAEGRPTFCGFYSVWEWEGDVPDSAGRWLDEAGHIEPFEAMMADRYGPLANRSPHPAGNRL